MANSSMPEMLPALEYVFPGFSLLARAVSLYLHIDLSSFSGYLILLAVSFPLFGFVIPRVLENLQRLLLLCTASIEIPYQDRLHGQFTQWMSTVNSFKGSSSSVARTTDGIIFPWLPKEDDDEDENDDTLRDQERFERNRKDFWLSLREKGSLKPVRYTPCRNKLHLFRYQGSLFALYRQSREGQNVALFMDAETITIYCLFWRQEVLLDLLRQVQKASVDRKKSRITIYRGIKRQNSVEWNETTSKPTHPLETLVLAPQIKENLLADLENFQSPKEKQWYRSHGTPYRRGYLLYGPPGTGKSSCCFVMAGHLCLDIYTLSLNSRRLDEDGVVSLFQKLPSRCIVLLEDVDQAGLGNRQTKERPDSGGSEESSEDNESGGISLSALLNCLDGVGAHEGHVLFMTTNHRDRLDPALIRPGRIDQSVYLGPAERSSIKQLFERFYHPETDRGHSHDIGKGEPSTATNDLSGQFADIVPSDQFTAAEILKFLMKFRSHPVEAIAGARDWVMNLKRDNGVVD